jgi:hypothetical protein
MTWPDGFAGGLRLDGRGRDLVTSADGSTSVVGQPTSRCGPVSGGTYGASRTHLNDALRSLEVPVLADFLPGR